MTTYVNRGDGFLALGSFMSGANASNTRFPETQPIVMQYDYARGTTPEEKKMIVYLHNDDPDSSLPAPTDGSVRLDVGGGEIIAAIKFEGNATKEVCVGLSATIRPALASTDSISFTHVHSLVRSFVRKVCEHYYDFLVSKLKQDVGPAACPADDRVEFSLAQYGPLHSLSPRLNEVWIRLKL